MIASVPQPNVGERPSIYTSRVKDWFLSWNKPNRDLGQHFTPQIIADRLAQCGKQFSGSVGVKSAARILDPGAGFGILGITLSEVLTTDIELVAYEVDHEIAIYLEICLSYMKLWMREHGRSLTFSIIKDDFVLQCAHALQETDCGTFDFVIENPPYFKLSKSDARAIAAQIIVHGQPNIYALFLAISASLLKQDGLLISINPRSFASGPYFNQFRRYFFSIMKPLAIHLFDSRRDLFSDVLQENMILVAKHSERTSEVIISSSNGSNDFSHVHSRSLPIERVLSSDYVLHVPTSDRHDKAVAYVQSWSGSLRSYGLEISTGPVVAFRATEFIDTIGDYPNTHAPLLWMQNVRPMQIEWPLERTRQYIRINPAAKLLVPNMNYVILRRFSAKEEARRLVAASYLGQFESSSIGLENHLNYIYRPGGHLSQAEACGLAALLNSELMDIYFRTYSGNTQVNASELRSLPLPPLELITAIGESIESKQDVEFALGQILERYA